MIWKWIKRLVVLGLSGLLLAVAVIAASFWYFDRGLPSVEALRAYKPPQVTKVLCADGKVCAEFFKGDNRRTRISVVSLPPHVKNAFIAAEDADFYKHEGLDYFGMARAALKSAIPGSMKQGASTISQQACRNLLLSQERTISRKIKEWILTPRMEKALSKDQILELYLNQIFFGHSRYGIEEAALYYFGKHARELSIGEAASLAGTVQSPNRINPETNMVKAKRRQRYVFGQLARHGFLPQAVVDKEIEKPIVLAPRPPPTVGPYYAEEVRRMLVARYGEKALYEDGMRVEIAMDTKLQQLADDAVRDGLESVDRRMGFNGPLGKKTPEEFAALRPFVARRIEEAGKRKSEDTSVADLIRWVVAKPEEEEEPAEEKVAAPTEEGEAPPSPLELEARKPELVPLKEGLRLTGYVQKVDDKLKRAEIDLIGRLAEVSFSTSTWARPRGVGKFTPPPKVMSDILKVGDLVRVKITKVLPAPAALEATIDQVPEVQGALVVINPENRHVVAMTGGYNQSLSPFNRATQAKRQPGSCFKPFLYAAALASQKYTSLSVVNDAPDPIRDPFTDKVWKPRNFEDGIFQGPMTLREALTKSKNTVSVRLAEALTPQVAIDFGSRAGITSQMPENYTVALGTGEVHVLELTNAYATLHSLGRFAEPVTLIRVMDAKGTVLEEHQSAFEEKLPPNVAYMATSLMRSVVEQGTATAVRELNRPAAGKTGTASEHRDAWFSGYTADYVATAWVGFDNHDPLGNGETGGKAALPIWLNFMRLAHEGLPAREFEVPPGISFARVDPQTGLLAGPHVPGRNEPFLEGTQPSAEAPPPGQADPNRFLMDEGTRTAP
ncbi:MAG: penicillin-binding protein 1A [Myxococcaceae bacterium]